MLIFYSSIIIIVDQLLKYLVRLNLQENQKFEVIDNFFSIAFVKNTGAAFGILKGQRILFITAAVIFFIFILYLYFNELRKCRFSLITVVFLIGGSLSNLIDRILFSYVTDFIAVLEFPVINTADIFIFLGVFMLIYQLIFESET